ncbi:MAG TPA: TetR/AcrR family transcriptional regulator [Streptosporangiaceae bacterium]|nr:TetR/AcrR family transcriptional regulator [Streptosporangiaceae bacterium]
MANRPQLGADTGSGTLWFSPPTAEESPRRALTRERVVAEALTVIGTDGAGALSMRALATRLGVVPAALYRHVRSKEQLRDLVVDGVLAEVDCQADRSLAWTEQVKVLAHRLRTVLENHPGIAGLLKTRDPLGPHSLTLAEAFLAPLQAAGLPERETALAFCLIYDYTLGFAQRPHHRQRAACPGHRDQAQTARVPPVTARRPLPRPGCPRRAHLGRQPRPAIRRRPRHPPRRARNSAAPNRPATPTLSRTQRQQLSAAAPVPPQLQPWQEPTSADMGLAERYPDWTTRQRA